ncbi:hypothetical protein AALO_G00053360 [Alosa alosa]|uniref:XK-related protein n=2 Tax=Alosa alosa TaxID=278164 RepID=A0AAV6H7Z8_9TELE|nr:hypothetical protein AALO_G00053360 [Alosa alosa]
MAAKSDGAAVSEQSETPSRCLVGPEQRPTLYRYVGTPYTLVDCCWVLCALLVFFSDGATDLWLAADYYLRGNNWWFWLTLLFVVVPSTVVQVLSFRWFVYDYTELSGTSSGAGPAACGGDFSTKGSDQRSTGNAAGASSLPATGTLSSTRRCCRVCMWIFQSVIHILQLGQVWR